MCSMDEAENILSINTEMLQQSVLRIASDSISLENPPFIYELRPDENEPPVTKITATFPTIAILERERALFGVENFSWVCIQVSFMKPNPAAGFEPPKSQ